ncbi:MAG TPA: hypothetical protein VGC19_10480 [Rhodanobacter sp.]
MLAPTGRKAATPKRAAIDAPIKHISPEEALAHIQALLEAKQERVRQGPTWPDAESPPQGGEDLHAASPSTSLPSEAAYSHSLAHERGEQSKRKG